jgi:hypothetical protein
MSAEERDPTSGRFQKGKSGNPRGRPRKATTVDTVVIEALGKKVGVTEGGKRRRVTKLEATVTQVANKGASGDPRATKLALDLAQKAEERLAQSPTTEELSASDEAIVVRLMARLRRIVSEEETNGSVE